MKMLLPAAAAAIALPASSSAAPPVPAAPGSECTFDSGITTCVQMTESRQEETDRFEDPDYPHASARRAADRNNGCRGQRQIRVASGVTSIRRASGLEEPR